MLNIVKQNILTESIQDLRQLVTSTWRHRSGITCGKRTIDRIELPLIKKTVYLDNTIPGIIEDTIDNLGLVTKDGRKPLIIAKTKTDYGWHIVLNLPPGIAFTQLKQRQEYFADAVKGLVTLERRNGTVHMDVTTGSLPSRISYKWDAFANEQMALPVPVGVSQRGVEVLDLAESPHLLVAGTPGFGKSNFLHVLIHSLLPHAQVCIIDLKRLEFAYLRDHALVTRNEDEAQLLLQALNKEMEKRIDKLERAKVVKVQDYKGEDMPYIVLVIDELAELRDDNALYYLDRIVRLARAVGISVVAATQRPSTKVINGDTRAMFTARLCYQVADELNSRMVLGESYSQAAYLPGIKGRGIYKFGLEFKEVQTMFLPLKQAKRLLETQEQRGWSVEPAAKRLLPR